MKTKVKRLIIPYPEGIKKGKLADNAENRAIAEKNWEKLEKINKKKLKKRN